MGDAVFHFVFTSLTPSIAWAMNGLPLEPDHGFPVRVIIPGQIGGRSVKVSARNTFDMLLLTSLAVAQKHRGLRSGIAAPCKHNTLLSEMANIVNSGENSSTSGYAAL